MNTNIDERALLRFASGEMSDEEETSFIAQNEIAGQDARWRDVVLTLVEHRRMVSALAEFAEEAAAPLAALQSPETYPLKHRNNRWFTPLAALTSLAAGLLVGLVVAHFRAEPRDAEPMTQASIPPQSSVAKINPPPQATAMPLAAKPVSLQDSRLLGLEPIIREDQAISLRKQGFQVEEQPTVYFIDGGNGRKWAVPTEKATVHFVSR